METYARQILNQKPDISRSEEVLDAWKILLHAIDCFKARKRVNTCKVPPEVYPFKYFLSMMFLSNQIFQ